MFDCGEGTQRQLQAARAGINRKMRIFITHMHGDHVLGLPGLLHSMSFLGRARPLEVYGPKGIKDFIESTLRTVPFWSEFPIHVSETSARRVLKTPDYEIRAAWADHGVPCLAFAFDETPRPGRFDVQKARRLGIPEGPLWKKLQHGRSVRVRGRTVRAGKVVGPPRKGVKVTYAVDTRPCDSVRELARGSNLLIHDSTFAGDAADRAREYWHSTCVDAAKIAKASKSRMLALFHVSAMYDDARPLLRAAKKVFPRTILAEDLMRLEVRAPK